MSVLEVTQRVPPTCTINLHVPGFVQQGGAQITRAQQTTKRRHVKSAVQRCQLASFLALLRNGTNAQRRQDMKGLNQRRIGHPVAVDAGVVVLRRKRSVWSVKEFEKKRQCQKMSSVKQYIGVRQDFEKTGNTIQEFNSYLHSKRVVFFAHALPVGGRHEGVVLRERHVTAGGATVPLKGKGRKPTIQEKKK